MLFQEGRNCWRIAQADRLSYLIDAESYFDAFVLAARQARNTIHILGWDLHSKAKLAPGLELGTFLHELLDSNPKLEIKILIWKTNLMYAFERESQEAQQAIFNRR